MCVCLSVCTGAFLCVGGMSGAPADGGFRGGRLVNVGSPALFTCFCLTNCVFVFYFA